MSALRVCAPAALTLALLLSTFSAAAGTRIDRHALVSRHNPVLHALDVDAPLTVGNGQFAFTADITGLQTFPELYHRQGVPIETLARWCWVSDPNTNNYTLADTFREIRHPDGQLVGYPTQAGSPAGDWLRKNPRIHPLCQVRLRFDKADGKGIVPEDIAAPHQTLDLWSGVLTSCFSLEGQPVTVTTVCHPDLDLIAIRIESSLISSGRMGASIAFPRGHDLSVKNTPPLDWSRPDSHQTAVHGGNRGELRLTRQVSQTVYSVAVDWEADANIRRTGPHAFVIKGDGRTPAVEFTLAFGSERRFRDRLPGFASTLKSSASHWKHYWNSGAALDFSGSTDPRAGLLEKRVILSQYLMGTQMAGDVPPQESGLTCATWYGKHHTEMIWWHAAHFALWGRDDLLVRNLEWYRSQLPAARELAKSRGLRGARWAKMTGPEMRESPGGNPLIVWNQPHMIHLCELLYRNAPRSRTLQHYKQLVLETADCMASMLHYDSDTRTYQLGPPLWIAQEIYDQATSQNPSFELSYWRWGIETAQLWRERLGLPREESWDHILQHLAPLPQKDGKYVALGSNPDTFDNLQSRHDHPTMLASLGLLPGHDVDRTIMQNTLDAVLKSWDWETKIWGWDYPMIAMTAARLGHPDTAIEVLLRDGPNNRYLPNGHCPQRSDEASLESGRPDARKREIAVYLPANGAFLSAVALLAAGWDGNTNAAPGFPADGTWKIREEGLKPLP